VLSLHRFIDNFSAIADWRATLQRIAVLIVGESGTGKTILFEAIAGLWRWGMGRVELPSGHRVMFTPREPAGRCFRPDISAHGFGHIAEALGSSAR